MEDRAENAYKGYFSKDDLIISKRKYFTDDTGYPNRVAYEDFARNLYEMEDEEQDTVFFLVTLNVDLRKSNCFSLAMGDYVLRKFFVDVQSKFDSAYIFRIQGEKFNIFVKDEDFPALERFLNQDNKYYDVYYGCTKEKYIYTRNAELIRKSVSLMYQNKTEKKNLKKNKTKIMGNIENTPVELQETDTRKYTSTMWYTTIKVTMVAPAVKDFTVYVFPTKLCPPLESIPLVVVIDDLTSYKAFVGKNINFGVEGILFTVNARFNRQGTITTYIYTLDQSASCDYDMQQHDGQYLPVTFGKRLDKGRELYPLKKNISGYYDYVILDSNDIKEDDMNSLSVSRGGIVTVNDIRYGVTFDDKCLDLVKQS